MIKTIITLLGGFLLIESTESASSPPQIPNNSIDKIVVYKTKRQLELRCNDRIIKTYRIALGKNPIGHKQRQGDYKTPEGIYKISGKNPNSKFHKSLRISYPNEQDLLCAQENCVHPGGDVMIHGLDKKSSWIGKAHANRDWTQGCIAVSNDEIEEIYSATKTGAVIQINA
ncbi:MAG: L,D-transpeptidase family protein [Candidatus Paracaedibacteraceae bacterium]|nr:L,D-transpeptidase family protein [Candidatus Paracaedibacteraceae bacterium]